MGTADSLKIKIEIIFLIPVVFRALLYETTKYKQNSGIVTWAQLLISQFGSMQVNNNLEKVVTLESYSIKTNCEENLVRGRNILRKSDILYTVN
jgi:hypothetical protein